MTIKPIRSDEELKAAFQQLEAIFQAEPGTPEAIKFRMEQKKPHCPRPGSLYRQQWQSIRSA